MSVTELAIKRPILFIVFFLALGGLGLFSYGQLEYELLPNISTPIVTVFTAYPGASPREVESTVTRKIEESIAGVSRIKRVTASSAESFSTVMVEFVQEADEAQAAQDIQRAVSRASPDLPGEANAPFIEKYSVSDAPVLRLGVTAHLPGQELFTLVNDQIKPRLAQLKGAGRVNLLGGAQREVKVLVNDGRLAYHQVSLPQVVGALGKANVDVPAGAIKDADASLGVRVPGKVTRPGELENLVIARKADGSTVRLRDVALVKDTTKEATVYNRIDRQAALGISLQKQAGANAVEVVELARAEMAKIEGEYRSAGLRFQVAQDSSEFTLEAARTVYKDFFIAIGLVALVMLVFLHSLRNALIVMLAIPTSLVSAFIMMYAMDYSLNMMTLLAMSLVIGILVDDSIVVLENIYRHLEMGKDRRTAALDGRNEIGFAALSITLVDVVVFLPMALVPGLIGSIVKEFSLVIVVSTLSSLVVSFTLTPMIASRFAKLEHLHAQSFRGRLGLFFEQNIDRLGGWYQSVLVWSLRHGLTTVALSVGLLVASLALVALGYVGAEFAPVTDKGEIALSVTMPPGTKLEETDRVVRRIEKRLDSLPEITRIFTNVGVQTGDFSEINGPEVAELSLSAVPAERRQMTISQLSRQVKAIASAEPGVQARVSPIGIFGAGGAPIQLLCYGNQRDSVLEAASLLLERIRPVAGIVSPRLSAQLGKPEVEVQVDRDKLAALGLDVEGVGAALRTALNGYGELKLRQENTEVPLRIVLQESDRARTDQLLDLSFVNDRGEIVYLKQFARVQLASGPSILERRNRSNAVVVLAQVVGRPSGDVGEDIKAAVAGMRFPAGVRLSYEGDLELQDDAFGALGLALVASITLVYLIMVALYNNWVYPFVVLFSIPVAVVGALLALALTAKSLNIFSIFGMLMMIGLVAKNAILLVDRANEVRAGGRGVLYALLEAGKTRLRPILMTTLAMVIGMLPLALASGAGSELNSPLAWVLVGGLSSSMFLTLVLVPVIYLLVARFGERVGRKDQTGSRSPVPAPGKVAVSKFIACLLLALGNPVTGWGQGVELSLAGAVQRGLDNHPQLKIARLEEEKARQKIREANSYRLPALHATGQYLRNLKPQVFFFPDVNIDPATGDFTFGAGLTPVEASLRNGYNAYVTLQFPLLNAQLAAGAKAAREARQVSQLQTLATGLQLESDIRKAYYNALVAVENRKLVEQSVARADLTLAETRNLLAKGMASDADTLRAYVSRENLKPDLLRAGNGVAAAQAYLMNLVGLGVGDSIRLTDTLAYQPVALPAWEPSYQAALSRRPDLQQLTAQLRAAEAQIHLERSKVLPSLSLVGQYQVQSQANDFRFGAYPWPQSHYLGLQLDVPLFAGFRNQATRQGARLSGEQIAQQLVQLRRTIATELQVSLQNLHEAQRRVESQSGTIGLAERSYRLVAGRYRGGLTKLSEVADAALALTQAKTHYWQAVHDLLLARLAYGQLVGDLDAPAAETPQKH